METIPESDLFRFGEVIEPITGDVFPEGCSGRTKSRWAFAAIVFDSSDEDDSEKTKLTGEQLLDRVCQILANNHSSLTPLVRNPNHQRPPSIHPKRTTRQSPSVHEPNKTHRSHILGMQYCVELVNDM